jgi:hypothetical protein
MPIASAATARPIASRSISARLSTPFWMKRDPPV